MEYLPSHWSPGCASGSRVRVTRRQLRGRFEFAKRGSACTSPSRTLCPSTDSKESRGPPCRVPRRKTRPRRGACETLGVGSDRLTASSERFTFTVGRVWSGLVGPAEHPTDWSMPTSTASSQPHTACSRTRRHTTAIGHTWPTPREQNPTPEAPDRSPRSTPPPGPTTDTAERIDDGCGAVDYTNWTVFLMDGRAPDP